MEKKLKKELRFSKSLGKLLIDNSLKENDDDFLLVSVNSYYKLEQTPTPDLFFGKIRNKFYHALKWTMGQIN